jgi:hypothetical protein
MGLDMYVFRTKHDIDEVGTEPPADTVVDSSQFLTAKGDLDWKAYDAAQKKVQVHYWRKHPDVHGWFFELWSKKGGKPASSHHGDNFNGGDWVRIDAEDLDALERDVKAGSLPHTEGFFFGESNGSIEEQAEDLEFIANAREDLKQGYKLFYTSSW